MSALRKILPVLLFAAACGPVKEPVPTGVTQQDLGGGKFRITATARAEEGTIRSGNPGAMQSTSCDAAKILLTAELKKPGFKNVRQNFRETGVELIYAGEYCRRTGLYDPEGKFERATEPAPNPGR